MNLARFVFLLLRFALALGICLPAGSEPSISQEESRPGEHRRKTFPEPVHVQSQGDGERRWHQDRHGESLSAQYVSLARILSEIEGKLREAIGDDPTAGKAEPVEQGHRTLHTHHGGEPQERERDGHQNVDEELRGHGRRTQEHPQERLIQESEGSGDRRHVDGQLSGEEGIVTHRFHGNGDHPKEHEGHEERHRFPLHKQQRKGEKGREMAYTRADDMDTRHVCRCDCFEGSQRKADRKSAGEGAQEEVGQKKADKHRYEEGDENARLLQEHRHRGDEEADVVDIDIGRNEDESRRETHPREGHAEQELMTAGGRRHGEQEEKREGLPGRPYRTKERYRVDHLHHESGQRETVEYRNLEKRALPRHHESWNDHSPYPNSSVSDYHFAFVRREQTHGSGVQEEPAATDDNYERRVRRALPGRLLLEHTSNYDSHRLHSSCEHRGGYTSGHLSPMSRGYSRHVRRDYDGPMGGEERRSNSQRKYGHGRGQRNCEGAVTDEQSRHMPSEKK